MSRSPLLPRSSRARTPRRIPVGQIAFALALVVGPVQAQLNEANKLRPASLQSNDGCGARVALDGDVAVLGAYQGLGSGTRAGAAHVYRGCGALTFEQTLTGTGAAPGAQFGSAVAVEGDLIVVGARRDRPPEANGVQTGSAFVYRFDGSVWQEVQKLVPADQQPSSDFGYSVAVGGPWILVGAIDHNGAGGRNGAVYAFRHNGSTWDEVQMLFKSPDVNSRFGNALSLDGERLLVGALYDRRGSVFSANSGSAHLFAFDGVSWVQTDVFSGSDTTAGDEFGSAVALDGARILIGAEGRRDAQSATHAGAAYVFEETSSGWIQTQILTANDAAGGAWFGQSLSLQGSLAVIGAFNDSAGGTEAGAAYAFSYDGSSWTQIQKLNASDADPFDHFGVGVALRNGSCVIGAYTDDESGNDAGAAYEFLAPPTMEWGVGLAGAGGIVPRLSGSGNTFPNATFTVHLDDFVGGTALFGLAGSAAAWPALGGTVYIDVAQPLIPFNLSAPGAPGVPGAGDTSFSVVVPPGLRCATVTLQTFGLDPAAPQGYSMSNALDVWFRN